MKENLSQYYRLALSATECMWLRSSTALAVHFAIDLHIVVCGAWCVANDGKVVVA
jgi:hypothetical protein